MTSCAEARLDPHAVGIALVRREEAGEVLGRQLGRFDGLLDRHAEGRAVEIELQQPLALVVPAHGAEGHPRLAVAERERGRQRGARALAGRDHVGMVRRREIEGHHPDRERKPERLDHLRRHQPGAARRERGHVALRVDGVHVHGAGAPGLRREALVLGQQRRIAAGVSRAQLPVRPALIDQLRALRRVVVRQQDFGRHHRLRRVAVVLLAIGEGELHRLDQQMAIVRARRPHRLQVEARHQRDGLQLGRPLGPEPALVELGVAEAQPRRLFDPGFEAGEVLALEQPVAGFRRTSRSRPRPRRDRSRRAPRPASQRGRRPRRARDWQASRRCAQAQGFAPARPRRGHARREDTPVRSPATRRGTSRAAPPGRTCAAGAGPTESGKPFPASSRACAETSAKLIVPQRDSTVISAENAAGTPAARMPWSGTSASPRAR